MQAGGHKRVLLIAFHYPPCATSSGLQRTLAFSTHLRELGWQPYVLSVHPRVYEQTSASQLADIPADVTVTRPWAFDAARDFAIAGRYWSRLAIPDRWRTWKLFAVPSACALVRRERIDAVWSTYPIATAHEIGALVARWTGRPWIADFRDPMVEEHPETGQKFPADPRLRAARLRIEASAARHAARMVFCTHGAKEILAQRFRVEDGKRLAVIPNGYDERTFADASQLAAGRRAGARRVLLHSGTIYPGEDRDPSHLFTALRMLLDEGAIAPDNFELRLRNPSNEEHFTRLARERRVYDVVSIVPAIPYREALAEMFTADGLLLLQGITSNPAVPAKCYEYMRAQRPVIGLVHPDGETARTLREVGIDTVAPLTDSVAIAALLRRWIAHANSNIGTASLQHIQSYSRQGQTAHLARLLDSVVASRA